MGYGSPFKNQTGRKKIKKLVKKVTRANWYYSTTQYYKSLDTLLPEDFNQSVASKCIL